MADIPDPPRHGGRRPGAGRRFKYGEPTRPIRVPRSLAPAVERWLAGRDLVPAAGEAVCRPDPAAPPLALALYGARVPAGFPSPADDYVEGRLDLNEHLILNREATFIFREGGRLRSSSGISARTPLTIVKGLPCGVACTPMKIACWPFSDTLESVLCAPSSTT